MTAQTTEPTGSAALCRVSVVGGDTQIDLGLPADILVGALVPGLVALVESRAPERSELEPEPEDRTWRDDVIDAVATLRRDDNSWSPISARRTGYVVFLLGFLATVATLWK